MTTTEKSFRKLGANRHDPAHKPQRHSPSESCDVHEDRGTRQAKLGHPERSVVSTFARPEPPASRARSAGAPPSQLLSEQASGPKSKPTRLRFAGDGARTVFVAGNFNGWQPQRLALQPDSAGGWKIDLWLPPGNYEYRFVVDGKWTDDPLAARVVENGYGGVNAVLTVQKG